MSKVPVGIGAYKRSTPNEPEIRLENRYVEKSPVNLKDGTALISRPGTGELEVFDGSGTATMTIAAPGVVTRAAHGFLAADAIVFSTTGALPTGVVAGTTYYVSATSLTTTTFKFSAVAGGTPITTTGSQSGVHTVALTASLVRGTYAKEGLFDSDLFVASGHQLYRYRSDGVFTRIVGALYGQPGHPYVAWMKGAAYEYMFIADGLLLQYYGGGTRATGTLTLTPSTPPDISTQKFEIGSVYYQWSATPTAGTQDGTTANPWLIGVGANDAASLQNAADLINYAGVPGTDFSASLPGPNRLYRADSTATTLVITSVSVYADGNAITTTESAAAIAWGAATLLGGNVHTLVGIESPDGVPIKALASLGGYVLAAVGDSQKFFYIEPGEVTIDPLNFASKESQPDNIVDMLAVGDRVLIMGGGSSENWYATGDPDLPFAPTKGYAYERGVVEGTAVVVGDNTVILVGNDNVVYAITGGAQRISDHGVEERIRVQLRREQGLT